LNINKIYNIIFKIGKWREKRFQLFIDNLEPEKSDILLDVGGYPHNWSHNSELFKKIVCLNFSSKSNINLPNVESIVGDGRNLNFNDKEFDIIFSNSVIEHVGSFEDQKQFAKELLRVGKKIWLQTPAKIFFLEPHFLFPFFHWFPLRVRMYLVYLTPWYWITKPSNDKIENMINTTRLLTKKELIELFPDCKILKEKFLFFSKSYIVYR